MDNSRAGKCFLFFHLLNCLVNTYIYERMLIIMKMIIFVIEKISVPKEIFLSDIKLVCSNLGFIGYNLIKLYETL